MNEILGLNNKRWTKKGKAIVVYIERHFNDSEKGVGMEPFRYNIMQDKKTSAWYYYRDIVNEYDPLNCRWKDPPKNQSEQCSRSVRSTDFAQFIYNLRQEEQLQGSEYDHIFSM